MQKSLVIALCVLATLVLIEAMPWYDGDYGNSGSSESENDEGFRADDGYGYNQGKTSLRGGGGRGGRRYGSGRRNGGRSGEGRPSYPSNNDGGYNYAFIPEDCPHCTIRSYGVGEENTNTFNLPRDAYGYGGDNGYSGGSEIENDGGFSADNGYGYNQGKTSLGGGSARGGRRNGSGRRDGEDCPHCTIKSYGVGENNNNTFNLPREAYS